MFFHISEQAKHWFCASSLFCSKPNDPLMSSPTWPRMTVSKIKAIVVKKLTKLACPDAKQFEDEARGVGKMRHKSLRI